MAKDKVRVDGLMIDSVADVFNLQISVVEPNGIHVSNVGNGEKIFPGSHPWPLHFITRKIIFSHNKNKFFNSFFVHSLVIVEN